ncbi:PAS domain-containing protein [Methylobacterium segetis]|uniref:PAS domain-containing protein n=1 Tax=Methylobacterium segetis TaxID=2488750 RepID=UPI0014055847|nr:PAS domain-containing protein [Methylobacterium segetis]
MNGPVTASDLAFSSREFLRMIEEFGLTGHWGWTFATDEHVWSPGLFRLLGLEPGLVRPSYDLLLHLVHPEDRASIDTAAEVRAGLAREATVRVIRPDGAMRILSIRAEIYVAPDGRPQAAAGIVLNVTDREALVRARAVERRRKWALFEQTRSFTCSVSNFPVGNLPHELSVLTGLPPEILRSERGLIIAREERAFWIAFGNEYFPSGKPFIAKPLLKLADGQTARFRTVVVPTLNADGGIERWDNFAFPADRQAMLPTDDLLRALQERVGGHHMRAARGLLDWSMHDLAAASGLSFSTIRRLEEDVEATAARSRHTAVAALRAAGIRFSLLDGGAIAVAKV